MKKQHKILWKCFDCFNIITTPHSNIPEKCNKCGGEYFRFEKITKKKKPKFDIKIDCYSNGAGVTIRNYKGTLGARVFEGKDYTKRYSKWIDSIIHKSKNRSKSR